MKQYLICLGQVFFIIFAYSFITELNNTAFFSINYGKPWYLKIELAIYYYIFFVLPRCWFILTILTISFGSWLHYTKRLKNVL